MKYCTIPSCENFRKECSIHPYQSKKPKKPIRRVPLKKKEPSVTQLIAKAQKIFNAYIRQRDSNGGYFTCISCNKDFPVSQMDAGHYVPVKRGSFLRLHEWNTNGECKGCNGFDDFHLIGYRKNLINKIGQEAVNWLEENRHTLKKWTKVELIEIINTYS